MVDLALELGMTPPHYKSSVRGYRVVSMAAPQMWGDYSHLYLMTCQDHQLPQYWRDLWTLLVLEYQAYVVCAVLFALVVPYQSLLGAVGQVIRRAPR